MSSASPAMPLLHLLGLVGTTVGTTLSSFFIAYIAYTQHDTIISVSSLLIYLLYCVIDFYPMRADFMALLWGFLSGFAFQKGHIYAATLSQSLCFLGIVIGATGLFYCTWLWGQRQHYVQLARIFGPFMLVILGLFRLSQHDLIFYLILHWAIVNVRTFVISTKSSVNSPLKLHRD